VSRSWPSWAGRVPSAAERERTAMAESNGAPLQVAHRGALSIAVNFASFLQALDTTIANVALPHIRGAVSATPEQITWVLTSYIVASAIMIPLTGWLADHYGRKKVLVTSVIGFTLSSALCGMAQSLEQIVLFRLLQGLSGAALIPQSQAVLLDINPPHRHGTAMAAWGTAVVFGPVIGPVLGGWLTDNYSWRWVFYINLPIGILAALGLISYMRETKLRQSSFDFFGFVTLSLFIGSLQIMLDRGQLQDWFSSTEISLEAALAALSFYLFAVHAATFKTPFVSPSLFMDRNFAATSVLIFVLGVVMFATLALLPPLLQELMHYPVATSGLVTAPRGVGTLISMVVVGRVVTRVDPRLLVGGGFALTAIAMWMMCGFSPLMGYGLVIWSGLLQGFGLGITWVPLSTVSFATLDPRLRSQGTSMFNLLRNIGSSIGIATIQALWVRNTQIMHARLGEHITPYGALQVPPTYSLSSPHGLAALNAAVTRQAEMIAYNNDFKLMLIITLAVIPCVFLLKTSGASAPKGPTAVE